MAKTHPPWQTKTREQCEADGEFYCDKTTPYNPPPHLEKHYHAEVREGSTEFGETAWICRHCGILIMSARETGVLPSVL
jgi:hypothetical protein